MIANNKKNVIECLEILSCQTPNSHCSLQTQFTSNGSSRFLTQLSSMVWKEGKGVHMKGSPPSSFLFVPLLWDRKGLQLVWQYVAVCVVSILSLTLSLNAHAYRSSSNRSSSSFSLHFSNSKPVGSESLKGAYLNRLLPFYTQQCLHCISGWSLKPGVD